MVIYGTACALDKGSALIIISDDSWNMASNCVCEDLKWISEQR